MHHLKKKIEIKIVTYILMFFKNNKYKFKKSNKHLIKIHKISNKINT